MRVPIVPRVLRVAKAANVQCVRHVVTVLSVRCVHRVVKVQTVRFVRRVAMVLNVQYARRVVRVQIVQCALRVVTVLIVQCVHRVVTVLNVQCVAHVAKVPTVQRARRVRKMASVRNAAARVLIPHRVVVVHRLPSVQTTSTKSARLVSQCVLALNWPIVQPASQRLSAVARRVVQVSVRGLGVSRSKSEGVPCAPWRYSQRCARRTLRNKKGSSLSSLFLSSHCVVRC